MAEIVKVRDALERKITLKIHSDAEGFEILPYGYMVDITDFKGRSSWVFLSKETAQELATALQADLNKRKPESNKAWCVTLPRFDDTHWVYAETIRDAVNQVEANGFDVADISYIERDESYDKENGND